MATQTPNLNLVLPDYADKADIGVVNDNFKKIDDFSGGGKVAEWLESIQQQATESLNKIAHDATTYLNSIQTEATESLKDIQTEASESLKEIQAEATESLNEIGSKANNVLDSIPDDYEALNKNVNQLKDTKADAIRDTSAKAASHTLHAQSGPMSVTLFGKTTETGTGDKSPDNPYAISGVDAAQVHVGGANLWPYGETHKNEASGGSSPVLNMTWNPLPGKHTISATCDVAGTTVQFNFRERENGVTLQTQSINVYIPTAGARSSVTFECEPWANSVSMFINKPATASDIMLNAGDTALPYEPYNANVINLPLLPDGAPLYGNGTVDDVVENDVVSGCDKTYTFNGTEAFGVFNASSWNTCAVFFASNTLSDIQGGVAPYSDRFSGRVMANSYSQEYIATHNTLATFMYFSISFERLGISPTKDVATATAALKAYLADNPLTVYYRSTAYTPKNDLRVCRTVRNFKKYVLTGDENYILISSGDGWSRFQCSDAITTKNGSIGYCNHYARQNVYPGFESGNGNECWFIWDNAMSIADFKAKLAERYAAGNPTVIVSNINPETYMSDPLPLRKPDALTTDTVTVTGSGETAVEYPHDTKHYTDSQHDSLAKAVESNAEAFNSLSEDIVNVKPTEYTLDTSKFAPLDIDDFSGYKQPYHPKVLYFADGFAGYKYWMVQTPVPIGGQPYIDRWENPCVYRSNNGIQWGNAENANPLDGLTASEIARTDYMSDPHLVWREDLKRLECWYRHTNRGSEELPTAILRKYTYDGVNWSEREVMIDYKNSHATDFHRSPAYIWDNEAGYYRAWYAPDEGVKYNTSVDGKTWGMQTSCVYTGSNSNTWHLDVEYIDGYYYLLSYDMGAKNVKCYRSTDCINFEFIKTILTPRDEITDYYRSCSMKDEHGKIRVYFSAIINDKHKLGVMAGEDFEHLEICNGAKVFNAKTDSPAAVDARHVFFDGVSLYDKLRELLGITVNDEPSDPLTGEIPVLVAGPAWYNTELAGAEQGTITSVVFSAEYEPDGTEDASWACDYENAGKIMAYRKGTEVVVSPRTGSDKIQLNLDSKYMFACDVNAYFKSLASIAGTEMWVAETNTNMSNVLLGNRVITEPITIPIGVRNLSYGFRSCSALITPPVLPNGLANINNAFSDCASITYLPELPSTINGMEGAFNGCTAATSALCVIPAQIKYLNNTFRNCVKLTGTIEVNAASLTGYKDCFLQVGRDSDGVVLTGSCPQLAELAETAGANGKVTVASA